MKQKFTQARKARRASGFHKRSISGGQSKTRNLKRDYLHPRHWPAFGCHVVRIQKILLKRKTPYSHQITKFIRHASVE